MFPVSANPRARTSKRGGRKRANARNTGTKYDAKPESPGMAFRTRTTSGPKPKPTLFTKYSPQTSPASNRAVRAVTSRCTARTGLCRYTPASFAKSFPVPIGTTPSATSPPLPWRSTPFATSCTVPSPPTATMRCAPACTARAASSAPWPGPSVRSTSTDHPWRWNSRAMGSSARAAAPRPAAGLRTTWAWIRGLHYKHGGPIQQRIGPRELCGRPRLRPRDRVLAAGGERHRHSRRGAVLDDLHGDRAGVETGAHRTRRVVMERRVRADGQRIAVRPGRPAGGARNGQRPAGQVVVLDGAPLIRREGHRPIAHMRRGGAVGERVVGP